MFFCEAENASLPASKLKLFSKKHEVFFTTDCFLPWSVKDFTSFNGFLRSKKCEPYASKLKLGK